MSTRVQLDGVPNEPLPFDELRQILEPILDALGGLDANDVESVTITARKVSARVAIRNRRGRRLFDSWARVARTVDFPAVES